MRSRVEGDKRTDSIGPRSDFPDASVDPTEARRRNEQAQQQRDAGEL
jgi:hypothetical protein